MKNTALCATLLILGPLCAGCATVDMGVIGAEAAGQAEASSATEEQRVLREASAAFQERAEEAGWAEASLVRDAARRALDVLIHGREAAGSAEAAADPVSQFIQARAYDVAEPEDVAASFAAEVREARIGVRAVNTAAARVVRGPARTAWSRREDVGAAETVVQLARRSRALFRDVSRRVDDRLDEVGREALASELAAYDEEVDRLSTAADALSEARPDVEFREVDAIPPPEPDVG